MPLDNADPAELIQRCINGERAAWSRFVRMYTPLVLNVLRGSSLTADDRADVSQEVWLKAHLHLSSVADPHRVPGWLRVVTWREMIKYAEQSRRLVPCGDSPATDDPALQRPIDEVVMAKLDGETLHTAVGYLRERERNLIMLLLSEPPLSYDEIGIRLRIPRGSIGPTRDRCFARLRTILGS